MAAKRMQPTLPEELYFKRVHIHRETLKLISSDPSAPTRITDIEETPQLEVDSLPPLHKAAAQGLSHTLAQLLDDGENVDQALPFGAHLDTNDRTYEFEGCTPLHFTCWFGHLKSIKLLLDRGASVHTRSATGQQALSFAVLGDNPAVAIVLLQRGADVNNPYENQRTALHDACFKPNAFLVHQLLEYGADLEAKTYLGYTALHFASY